MEGVQILQGQSAIKWNQQDVASEEEMAASGRAVEETALNQQEWLPNSSIHPGAVIAKRQWGHEAHSILFPLDLTLAWVILTLSVSTSSFP